MMGDDDEDFRLYPKGDPTYKEFIPGETVHELPKFSFDKSEKQELGTVKRLDDNGDEDHEIPWGKMIMRPSIKRILLNTGGCILLGSIPMFIILHVFIAWMAKGTILLRIEDWAMLIINTYFLGIMASVLMGTITGMTYIFGVYKYERRISDAEEKKEVIVITEKKKD